MFSNLVLKTNCMLEKEFIFLILRDVVRDNDYHIILMSDCSALPLWIYIFSIRCTLYIISVSLLHHSTL